MHVASEAIVGRCKGIVSPEFVPIAETAKDSPGYESWSRFCLEHVDLLQAKAAALGVPALGQA
jgi:hypothetical protein